MTPEETDSISGAELGLRNAESEFGSNDPRLVPFLVALAQALKSAKVRLLEAANLLARAEVLNENSSLTPPPDANSPIDQSKEKKLFPSLELQDRELKVDEPQTTKTCPFCAEIIKEKAVRCRFCQAALCATDKGIKKIRLSAKDTSSNGQVIEDTKDPLLMACISGCCICGLGQMLMGQVAKGIVILLASATLGTLTAGVSVFISFPVAALDAYLIASKLKNGQDVGKWEFF